MDVVKLECSNFLKSKKLVFPSFYSSLHFLNRARLAHRVVFIDLVKRLKQIQIIKISSRSLRGILLKWNAKKRYAFQLMTILFWGSLSSNAIAALSATTTNVIHGSEPYLTFDGGVTKAITTDELVSITLSDGKKYTAIDSVYSAKNPIKLPVARQKLKDIKTLIPDGSKKVTLTDVISKNGYWNDHDGDGSISSTGYLIMEAEDVNGNIINSDTELTGCNSPYKITLTSSDGVLSTEYGIPPSSTFIGSNAIYYIIPKEPEVCFAQPNLTFNGKDNVSYRGPANQWDDTKGFKPQNINDPISNFPTMGAEGLFFNLVMDRKGISEEVRYSKLPKNSGIDLKITSQDKNSNIVKVELIGPGHGSNAAQAATAVPTTFTIYSDKEKVNKIYSFQINKWFIIKPGDGYGYSRSRSYCDNLNYRIPDILELTNANGNGWKGGLSGQPNIYQRRIGGGLFAEWGYTSNDYYKNSTFEYHHVWTSLVYNSSRRYLVFAYNGDVIHDEARYEGYQSLCVR